MITRAFENWKLEPGNWFRFHVLFSGLQLLLLVCLGTSHAAAQAAAEYGGAVSAAGAHVLTTPFPKVQSPATPQAKSAHLTPQQHPSEDTEAANRKALEARAGKNAAKLMLRSEPSKASVRVDGKPVGQTPLLLMVAPGVYKVEMEGLSTQVARQQVDLLPKETREVLLALQSRYPTHVQLRWQAH
jgi:hypothetical protein